MGTKISSWAKGRIAETLVERIFFDSDYKIRIAATWKCSTLEEMRIRNRRFNYEGAKPDYLVSRGKSEPEWVEVKYRFDGNAYSGEDELVGQCNQYGQDSVTRFNIIVVRSNTRPYFNVVRAPYFNPRGHFVEPISLIESGWKLRDEVIEECERLIEAGIFDWE